MIRAMILRHLLEKIAKRKVMYAIDKNHNFAQIVSMDIFKFVIHGPETEQWVFEKRYPVRYK
jgi:hypothetical protein